MLSCTHIDRLHWLHHMEWGNRKRHIRRINCLHWGGFCRRSQGADPERPVVDMGRCGVTRSLHEGKHLLGERRYPSGKLLLGYLSKTNKGLPEGYLCSPKRCFLSCGDLVTPHLPISRNLGGPSIVSIKSIFVISILEVSHHSYLVIKVGESTINCKVDNESNFCTLQWQDHPGLWGGMSTREGGSNSALLHPNSLA